MAQIKFVDTKDAAGIRLTDTMAFKGKHLELEFEWTVDAEVDCDPSANCLEKFRAYFAQAAAAAWNKTFNAVRKKADEEFDRYEKAAQDFVEKIEQMRKDGKSIDADKTVDAYLRKQETAMEAKLDEMLDAELANDLLNVAEKSARERIVKEGTKLKPSKAKIAKKVLKVLLVLGVAAAAIVAAVATHGAAVPLLVAVAGWMSLTTGTLKKLVDSAKTLSSLRDDLQSDVVKMEKQIAQLDTLFRATVVLATQMEGKADALEMEGQDLKKAIVSAKEAMDGVNPKGKAGSDAKALDKKLDELSTLVAKSDEHRVYAEPLRSSYAAFLKVKQGQDWGTKLDSAKEAANMLDYVAKGLAGVASVVKT